ncbi:MAG: LysR family transcriptional regulator, positive regulator for ilvC [Verrucomicrobiota bacterium]|jgi:DNA-binding transcriptional LysR family regulator
MPYGIQQPAISGQILQLERTIGTKLFHRRPFGLTPAGAKLHSEIEHFFAGLRELPDQILGHAKQHLRLAAPAAIQRDYLPGILKEYKRHSRDFALTLYDANQATAEELLRKHEIDIAITELEGRPAKFVKSCMLVRLPLVLVVSKRTAGHSLADFFHNRTPTESLISLPQDEVISKLFHSGLKKLGLGWTPTIEVSTLELIDTYASLGFGVGVSVAIPRAGRKSDLRVVPLLRFPPLNIAALWAGDLPEPAATFLTDVKKLAVALNR